MTTCIMSKELVDFSEKLSSCMGTGICDKNVHNKIAASGFKKYEKIFNFLTGQLPVNSIDPTYSMYKVSLFTGQASHHIDISASIGNMYYTTIQADDKFLFLNCLSLESLMTFLIENSKETNTLDILASTVIDDKTYIFIPVVFGSEVNTVGHFGLLTFNIVTREVFFIDPNGKSGFFDNIFYVMSGKCDYGNEPWMKQYSYSDEMYIDTENLVENMIELYITNLNTTFGTNYKFVKRAKWNAKGYTINKNYDASLIGSGHCVCTGTLIANYLHITKDTPSSVFEKLSKMSQSEIIELINSYSIGMYSLLQYTD